MIDSNDELWRETVRQARAGDPWCRIMVAAVKGRGVRLSADEVATLSRDQAISANAEMHADSVLSGASDG